MTVKRKTIKPFEQKQYDIDDVINRGGKTTEENINRFERKEPSARFTMRIPQTLMDEIDANRKERVGNFSRNQWIIEAILERLNYGKD